MKSYWCQMSAMWGGRSSWPILATASHLRKPAQKAGVTSGLQSSMDLDGLLHLKPEPVVT
jgi:hypothetical protein